MTQFKDIVTVTTDADFFKRNISVMKAGLVKAMYSQVVPKYGDYLTPTRKKEYFFIGIVGEAVVYNYLYGDTRLWRLYYKKVINNRVMDDGFDHPKLKWNIKTGHIIKYPGFVMDYYLKVDKTSVRNVLDPETIYISIIATGNVNPHHMKWALLGWCYGCELSNDTNHDEPYLNGSHVIHVSDLRPIINFPHRIKGRNSLVSKK